MLSNIYIALTPLVKKLIKKRTLLSTKIWLLSARGVHKKYKIKIYMNH